MFVLFHDPRLTPTVPHSLGLTKGLIGVVYAFAEPYMNGENDAVIAHESLHTLGATDKYDPASDAPRYPDGYGDPREVPLYPQQSAELMAGRRMLSATRWVQADDLDEVVIGPATAFEIRWPIKPIERPAPSREPASTSPCRRPLVASTEPEPSVIGAPPRSVKRPPASVTIATLAAMSRMFTSDSITASILPAASR